MNALPQFAFIFVLVLLFAVQSSNTVQRHKIAEWRNYSYNNWVEDFAEEGEYLWIATRVGLYKLHKPTGAVPLAKNYLERGYHET